MTHTVKAVDVPYGRRLNKSLARIRIHMEDAIVAHADRSDEGHGWRHAQARAGATFMKFNLLRSVMFLCMGAYFVTTGLHRYRLFDVFVGIEACLFSPLIFLASIKPRLASTQRLWMYHLACTLAWCGAVPLVALGGVHLIGVEPTVTTTQLVQHPILYNERLVHTSGMVLAGGGKCSLQIAGRTISDAAGMADHGSGIWMSSASALCAAPTTSRVRVKVSGTFYVLQPREHKPRMFILTNAEITPAARSRRAPST